MFIRAPRRSLIVFVPQQRPAQVCHGPHHAHHSAARAVASRDASPVDMSLRRAALEVCSTSGRSLLPRALAARAWTRPTASLWTQTRGRKSTRRVERLHQVRAAPTPRPTAPVNYAARSPEFPNAIRFQPAGPADPRPPRTAPNKKPGPPTLRPSQDIEGLVATARSSACAPSRAQSLVPTHMAVYVMPTIEDAARRRAVEGEIAEDAGRR